jgi:hypothetical protein
LENSLQKQSKSWGKEFWKRSKEEFEGLNTAKKLDRIVEVKCHTVRYSILISVVDFAVGTNWVRDRLALMWDGEE